MSESREQRVAKAIVALLVELPGDGWPLDLCEEFVRAVAKGEAPVMPVKPSDFDAAPSNQPPAGASA